MMADIKFKFAVDKNLVNSIAFWGNRKIKSNSHFTEFFTFYTCDQIPSNPTPQVHTYTQLTPAHTPNQIHIYTHLSYNMQTLLFPVCALHFTTFAPFRRVAPRGFRFEREDTLHLTLNCKLNRE